MSARTLYWIGPSGAVTFLTAAYWSDSDGGGPASLGVPVSGDTCIVNRGTSNILGVDLSALILAALYCTAPVTWGSSGTAFKVGFANPASAAIVCAFSGDYGDTYFSPVCAGTNCIVMFSGQGNVWLSGATAQGTLICGGGRIAIASTFTNATAGNFPIVVTAGNVYVEAGTTNAVNVDVQDGALFTGRNVNTATVSGRMTITGSATVTSSTVNPLGLHIHQSSGTITMITLKSGGNASDAGATAPFTVTNATGYGNVQLFTRGNPLITYTNQPNIYTGGGLAIL